MRKGLGVLLFGIIASANAFADDESLLLPNTTNQDACVADNTGVYETGFEMEPVYEDTTFTCQDGQYLPANSETCTSCPNGYACPGGDFKFDATNDQGKGKFVLKTTSLSANDTFDFSLSAVGTFTVNCGENGTLTSSADPTDVSGNTITRSGTTLTTYTCTYTTGGVKTITFDGTATGYNNVQNADNSFNHTISFYVGADDTAMAANTAKIASIHGTMVTIFPQISNMGTGVPKFLNTFKGATHLTSIPSTLFDGYTIGSNYMFGTTFDGCTGLTSLPSGLFSSFQYGSFRMFSETFKGCTNLASLPNGLFANITTAGANMFAGTFYVCRGLTTIPEDMFSGLKNGYISMFNRTFYGCTGLTSIPERLFASFESGATTMFSYTFQGCNGLTSIPENLFANFTRGEDRLFQGTFQGCTGLTSLPDNLFANITTAAEKTFFYTFYGCTHLSGYIPPTLFAGLIANGSPYETDMMTDIFTGTGLATSCAPYEKTQYITGYEDYWSTKVSCGDAIECPGGKYLAMNTTTCATCSENNYCAGGSFGFNAKINQGITACPNNLLAPAGMSASTQCGRKLHIGDAYVYMRSAKKTTPSLNIDLEMDGTPDFFGNMTKIPVPMNIDVANLNANNKLVIEVNDDYVVNNETKFTAGKYYVYDDTMNSEFLRYVDATINGTEYGYQNDSLHATPASSNTSIYGITEDQMWGVTFPYGKMVGEALCSTNSDNPAETNSGQYCWCHPTKIDGNDIGPSVWYMAHTYDNNGYSCATSCAGFCAGVVFSGTGYRRSIFGQSN